MSTNTAGLRSLGELQVLLSLVPGSEVVSEISQALEGLPEFALFDRVMALNTDAERIEAQEKEVLSDAGTLAIALVGMKVKISALNVGLSKFKADLKNKVLSSSGITGKRAELLGFQKIADFLEEQAQLAIIGNLATSNMQEELRALVMEANKTQAKVQKAVQYAKELRTAKVAVEKEAQELIASVVTS